MDGRGEPEDVGEFRYVSRRVHPHQHQVVALREHLRVELLRALRREQQPEAELPSLPRDLNRALDERLLDGTDRLRGTEVVGFVHHDQQGVLVCAAPESSRASPRSERRARRGRRTRPGPDRSPSAPRPGSRLPTVGTGADLPVGDTEVVDPLRQHRPASSPARRRARTPRESAGRSPPDCWRSRLYSSRFSSGSRRSTAAWARRGIVANRMPQRLRAGRRGAQHPNLLRCQPRGVLGRCPGQRLPEPDEVGVRVEHHHPQVGAEQQLLEDHPERVGLARAALAAQERVPPEALGPQPGRHLDATGGPGPDRQVGARAEPWRAPSSPGPDRLHRGRPVGLA